MKNFFNPGRLSVFCAFAGAVCLGLQQWLLGDADEKGLLIASHPARILSWVVVLAVAVLIGYGLWGKVPRYTSPPVPLSGIGALICAVGFACAAWSLFSQKNSLLETPSAIGALICALCALAQGILRLQKKRPGSLLYLPAILFFLLFLLAQYRHWSAEPELQRYFFALAAHVCIMLSAYYRAAAEVGFKKSKNYLIFSCFGIFFCLSASADLWLFYVPMALYLLLDNCTLVEKKSRPTQET